MSHVCRSKESSELPLRKLYLLHGLLTVTRECRNDGALNGVRCYFNISHQLNIHVKRLIPKLNGKSVYTKMSPALNFGSSWIYSGILVQEFGEVSRHRLFLAEFSRRQHSARPGVSVSFSVVKC